MFRVRRLALVALAAFSLVALAPTPASALYSEGGDVQILTAGDFNKIVVKDGDRSKVALFDLSQDPGETRDLTRTEDAAMLARRSGLLARGRQWRESLREAALPAVQRGLDDDLQADLRALGYIK